MFYGTSLKNYIYKYVIQICTNNVAYETQSSLYNVQYVNKLR